MSKPIIDNDDVIHYEQLFDSKFELGVRLQDKDLSFPEHSHDYVEIVCQVSGQSVHYIDKTKYILNENEILIINPKQVHENIASDSDVINLIISTRYLTNLVIESAFDYEVVALKNNLLTHIHLTKYKITDDMVVLLQNIYINLTMSNKQFYYIKQRLAVSCFLIELFENVELKSKQVVEQQLDVLTYIHENLQTASLTDFARINNFSVSKLSQLIKKEYNLTFIEIVHEIRLKTAANLLQTTNMKIDDIVYFVGYQNKTHFYKLFKNKYMLTPSQFKKEYN